jgi:hypothetical protein
VSAKSKRFRRVTPDIKARIADLMPWHFSEFSEHGISYHTCRFCGLGSETFDGLWKYGIRHYVCADCRDAITGKKD